MSESAPKLAADCAGLTDAEVVARVLGGELQIFEVLMRRYNQRLFRAARSILKTDAEAEDVVQDAYVRAYQHLNQFEGRASFATWLTRIAVTEALARKRKAQHLVQVESMDTAGDAAMNAFTSTAPNPEEEAMARSVTALLETAVDSLPEAYRSVFMLREIEGLNTNEAAECLGLSRGSRESKAASRPRDVARGDLQTHRADASERFSIRRRAVRRPGCACARPHTVA